jgi:hypothetical protein
MSHPALQALLGHYSNECFAPTTHTLPDPRNPTDSQELCCTAHFLYPSSHTGPLSTASTVISSSPYKDVHSNDSAPAQPHVVHSGAPQSPQATLMQTFVPAPSAPLQPYHSAGRTIQPATFDHLCALQPPTDLQPPGRNTEHAVLRPLEALRPDMACEFACMQHLEDELSVGAALRPSDACRPFSTEEVPVKWSYHAGLDARGHGLRPDEGLPGTAKELDGAIKRRGYRDDPLGRFLAPGRGPPGSSQCMSGWSDDTGGGHPLAGSLLLGSYPALVARPADAFPPGLKETEFEDTTTVPSHGEDVQSLNVLQTSDSKHETPSAPVTAAAAPASRLPSPPRRTGSNVSIPGNSSRIYSPHRQPRSPSGATSAALSDKLHAGSHSSSPSPTPMLIQCSTDVAGSSADTARSGSGTNPRACLSHDRDGVRHITGPTDPSFSQPELTLALRHDDQSDVDQGSSGITANSAVTRSSAMASSGGRAGPLTAMELLNAPPTLAELPIIEEGVSRDATNDVMALDATPSATEHTPFPCTMPSVSHTATSNSVSRGFDVDPIPENTIQATAIHVRSLQHNFSAHTSVPTPYSSCSGSHTACHSGGTGEGYDADYDANTYVAAHDPDCFNVSADVDSLFAAMRRDSVLSARAAAAATSTVRTYGSRESSTDGLQGRQASMERVKGMEESPALECITDLPFVPPGVSKLRCSSHDLQVPFMRSVQAQDILFATLACSQSHAPGLAIMLASLEPVQCIRSANDSKNVVLSTCSVRRMAQTVHLKLTSREHSSACVLAVREDGLSCNQLTSVWHGKCSCAIKLQDWPAGSGST